MALASTDVGYRCLIFDTTGALSDLPVITNGSFTDVINGGSAEGSFDVPRRFVDTGWVFYEYRVQFFLNDSVDPFYDGRVIDIDQTQLDNQEYEYITIRTEGWSSRLARAIVSEVLTPGGAANGMPVALQYGDGYLAHLIGTYQDASTFGTAFVSNVAHVLLDKTTFDGTELNSCIDTIVKQMTDNTGNTFEWFVRSTAGGKPSIVVQPSQNPNKIPVGTLVYQIPGKSKTADFQYEFKDSTIHGYNISNSSRGLFNMVAMYGGSDPQTQRQVYGAFKDSTSISLYGLRQKKITKQELISSTTLSNYAAVYLLLNGYPQPQGTFKKVFPSGALLAGQWIGIFEPGVNPIAQNYKQVRVVKVTTSFTSDHISQTVSISAPRPYIDNAYYGALNSARNAGLLPASGVNALRYFIGSGLDWIRTVASPLAVVITPPQGNFNSNVPIQLAAGPDAGNYDVLLQDSVTGVAGDGYFEVSFVKDTQLYFGIGVTDQFYPTTPTFGTAGTPGIVCTKGVYPTDPGILKGWGFTVIGGVIAGAIDLRIIGIPKNLSRVHYSAPTYSSATASTPVNAGVSSSLLITIQVSNVPQDLSVSRFAWAFRAVSSTTTRDLLTESGLTITTESGATLTTEGVTTVVATTAFSVWAETSLPLNPAQSLSLSFQFAGLSNGSQYEFAGAFVSTGGEIGDYGSILTTTAFPGVSVGAQYLTGGASPIPHLSATTAVPTLTSVPNTGVSGLTATVEVVFTVDNQPQDGSLSRLSFYIKGPNDANFAAWASIPAINLPSPRIVETYTFDYNGLTNGQTYTFAVKYENQQGGESTGFLTIGTLVAQSIVVTTGYLMANKSPGVAPNLTYPVSPFVVVRPSLTGLTTTLSTTFTITNQPTDGSLSRISMLIKNISNTNIAQIASFPAIGLPTPTASQQYTFDYNELTAGSTYALYVAFEDAQGGESAVAQIGTTPYQAGSIGIQSAYLAGGTSPIPHLSTTAPALTITSIPNTGTAGVTSTVELVFTLDNQPQDGSLSRLSFFVKALNDTSFASWASIAVPGLPNPPAVQQYTFDFNSLVNGQTYTFAVKYENQQGGESTDFLTLGSPFVAKSIVVTTGYLMANKTPGVGPTLTYPGSAVVLRATLTGLTATLSTTFVITNQPTDGSLSRISMLMRNTAQSGTSAYQVASFPAIGLPTPNASQQYSFDYNELTAGSTYALYVAFEDAQGGESVVTQIGGTTAFWTAGTIGIQSGYMVGGTSLTPVLDTTSPHSATVQSSVNNISAAVALTFTLSNQPIDGSLSRVQIWVKPNGIDSVTTLPYVYAPYGSIPALNLNTPAAKGGPYTFVVAELVGGKTYDFGASYENAQGGESLVGDLFTNVFVIAITVGTPYLLNTNVAYVLSLSGLIGPTSTLSANGISVVVKFSVTITNQPTDGSPSRYNIWRRPASPFINDLTAGSRQPGNANCAFQLIGAGPVIGLGSNPGPASGTYTEFDVDVTGGQTVDYGISLENTAGNETAIAPITPDGGYQVTPISLLNNAMRGVPSGASLTANMTFAAFFYTASASLRIDISANLTSANFGDNKWIDRVVIYYYYFDSQNPGKIQIVNSIPSSGSMPTGSVLGQIGGLPKNYSGSYPSFSYGFLVRVFAANGYYVESATTLCQEGNAVTTLTTKP